MSDRSMWKMLHLLYTLTPGRPGLSDQELRAAGIDCGSDTIYPLVHNGAVSREAGQYALTPPARQILGSCVVANRRWSSDDLWVDYPSVFVIMPFSESWSTTVYQKMIEPAVVGASLKCVRGDTVVRVGDLTQNIWGALLQAGIIVADVTALNANVFYELGLTHALGKDSMLLRQSGSKIPADFGGAHYHEYDLADLDEGKAWLSAGLRQWADDSRCQAVRLLHDV